MLHALRRNPPLTAPHVVVGQCLSGLSGLARTESKSMPASSSSSTSPTTALPGRRSTGMHMGIRRARAMIPRGPENASGGTGARHRWVGSYLQGRRRKHAHGACIKWGGARTWPSARGRSTACRRQHPHGSPRKSARSAHSHIVAADHVKTQY